MEGSNIVSAIHHLKLSAEHFEDFKRQHPGSKGAKLFEGYIKRIEWIFKDLVSHPFLDQDVRDGIKREINSDVFTVPAIAEKIALLNPMQRELIEIALEEILAGKLTIVKE